MRYKAVFKVSYRGFNPQNSQIEDQISRHSIEFDVPTNAAAKAEASNDFSETLVHLKSAYIGMTNVRIELIELWHLMQVEI